MDSNGGLYLVILKLLSNQKHHINDLNLSIVQHGCCFSPWMQNSDICRGSVTNRSDERSLYLQTQGHIWKDRIRVGLRTTYPSGRVAFVKYSICVVQPVIKRSDKGRTRAKGSDFGHFRLQYDRSLHPNSSSFFTLDLQTLTPLMKGLCARQNTVPHW